MSPCLPHAPPPMVQYAVVYRRDGTIPRRCILSFVYGSDGRLTTITRGTPLGTPGPVFSITERLFLDLVARYDLRVTRSEEERRQLRKERAERYRKQLAAQMPPRPPLITPAIRDAVRDMLLQNMRGADIARQIGVSTSTITRIKQAMEMEQGAHEYAS